MKKSRSKSNLPEKKKSNPPQKKESVKIKSPSIGETIKTGFGFGIGSAAAHSALGALGNVLINTPQETIIKDDKINVCLKVFNKYIDCIELKKVNNEIDCMPIQIMLNNLECNYN